MSQEPQETPIKLFKHLVESYDEPDVNSPSSHEALLVSYFGELFQQLKSKIDDLNLLEVVRDNLPVLSELQELLSKFSQPGAPSLITIIILDMELCQMCQGESRCLCLATTSSITFPTKLFPLGSQSCQ